VATGRRFSVSIACSIRDTPPGSVGYCDGRSPDSRVFACPAFPCPPRVSVGGTVALGVARRLQLRGQSRNWRLLPTPHRIPFSPGRAWFGREPSPRIVLAGLARVKPQRDTSHQTNDKALSPFLPLALLVWPTADRAARRDATARLNQWVEWHNVWREVFFTTDLPGPWLDSLAPSAFGARGVEGAPTTPRPEAA
jgi:hypothetical protein